MKQKQLIFCMGLSAIALLTSCNEREFEFPSDGKDKSEMGKIVLNLNADASFGAQTRSLDEADYRNTANYTVEIWQGDNKLKTYTGPQSSLEFTHELGSNNTFTIKAFYGEELPASRDKFYVYGDKTVTLTSENPEQPVTVSCFPTCGKLLVSFASDMAKYYKKYSVTYKGTEALGADVISFDKDNCDPYYVKLKSDGETLTYTINLELNDDYVYVDEKGNKLTTGTATGSVSLQRNHAHKLTVAPHYTPNADGTFTLTITVDVSTNDIPKTFTVPVEWI